jgi:hypothetical protein
LYVSFAGNDLLQGGLAETHWAGREQAFPLNIHSSTAYADSTTDPVADINDYSLSNTTTETLLDDADGSGIFQRAVLQFVPRTIKPVFSRGIWLFPERKNSRITCRHHKASKESLSGYRDIFSRLVV